MNTDVIDLPSKSGFANTQTMRKERLAGEYALTAIYPTSSWIIPEQVSSRYQIVLCMAIRYTNENMLLLELFSGRHKSFATQAELLGHETCRG